MELTGRTLCDGEARGRVLVLRKPVSFWGGVDPRSGVVSDPRHPQHRAALAGRILVMDRTIGSSSSSAVMLELLRNGVAPAGIVVGRSDAILIVGVLVARELGYPTIPLLGVGESATRALAAADGLRAVVRPPKLRIAARA